MEKFCEDFVEAIGGLQPSVQLQAYMLLKKILYTHMDGLEESDV